MDKHVKPHTATCGDCPLLTVQIAVRLHRWRDHQGRGLRAGEGHLQPRRLHYPGLLVPLSLWPTGICLHVCLSMLAYSQPVCVGLRMSRAAVMPLHVCRLRLGVPAAADPNLLCCVYPAGPVWALLRRPLPAGRRERAPGQCGLDLRPQDGRHLQLLRWGDSPACVCLLSHSPGDPTLAVAGCRA